MTSRDSRTHSGIRRFLPLAIAVCIAGCVPSTPPGPPEATLNQGMLQSVIDTGLYSEVRLTRTVGRHYEPSRRVWKVLACFRFKLASGEDAETCVDSFEAYELNNGTWVVAVTIEGIYRWRAIGAAEVTRGRSASDRGGLATGRSDES